MTVYIYSLCQRGCNGTYALNEPGAVRWSAGDGRVVDYWIRSDIEHQFEGLAHAGDLARLLAIAIGEQRVQELSTGLFLA